MDLERRRRLNRNRRIDLLMLPELWISAGVSAGTILIFVGTLLLSAYLKGQVGKILIMLDMLAFFGAIGNFFYAARYVRKKDRDALSRAVIFTVALVAVLVWAVFYGVGVMLR